MEKLKIKLDDEIVLRQIDLSDTIYIFDTIDSQREYLGKWLPFVEHTKDISDTQAFVQSIVNAPMARFEFVFTIWKLGHFAGLIGFKDTDKQNQKTEMGYWLAKEYQKQGIITKSVDKLCEFAFETMGMNRVQVKCASTNIASINIPKRLGFRFEGVEREGELLMGNTFVDLLIYSKLKSD